MIDLLINAIYLCSFAALISLESSSLPIQILITTAYLIILYLFTDFCSRQVRDAKLMLAASELKNNILTSIVQEKDKPCPEGTCKYCDLERAVEATLDKHTAEALMGGKLTPFTNKIPVKKQPKGSTAGGKKAAKK